MCLVREESMYTYTHTQVYLEIQQAPRKLPDLDLKMSLRFILGTQFITFVIIVIVKSISHLSIQSYVSVLRIEGRDLCEI